MPTQRRKTLSTLKLMRTKHKNSYLMISLKLGKMLRREYQNFLHKQLQINKLSSMMRSLSFSTMELVKIAIPFISTKRKEKDSLRFLIMKIPLKCLRTQFSKVVINVLRAQLLSQRAMTRALEQVLRISKFKNPNPINQNPNLDTKLKMKKEKLKDLT